MLFISLITKKRGGEGGKVSPRNIYSGIYIYSGKHSNLRCSKLCMIFYLFISLKYQWYLVGF